MNVISAISSLSADEKNFLRTSQITAAKTSDEWIAFFKKLKGFDNSGDRTRKIFASIGCFGLVFAILVFIFLGLTTIGMIIFPILLILILISFGACFYIKRFDINSGVLDNTLVPLLAILREEVNQNEPIKIRLDLTGYSKTEKLSNQTPAYSRGAYYSIVDSFYKDAWLDGETVLVDGTKLIWTVEDFIKQTDKRKRNYRGKHKSKSKTQFKTLISMQIGMHKKRYTLPEKIKQKSSALGAIRTKQTDDYHWMSVRKIIKNTNSLGLKPQEFVNSIASAYVHAVPTAGGNRIR